MNLFAVLLFACFGQTIRSYECISGFKSYLEKLERSGGVYTQSKISLDCKGGKITKVWTEPVKPNKKHGSILQGGLGSDNTASLTIKTVRRLWFRCSDGGRREGRAVFVKGDRPLNIVKKDCPSKMRALITVLDPMNYDRFDETRDFIEKRCIGQSECSIDKGLKVATSKYKIETDCRDENYALHCCNSEEAQDTEMNRAMKACNVKLKCECCNRKRDKRLNIRTCGAQRWAPNLIGINYNLGIGYGESDDIHATDGNPDFDEDGCHVRKAELKLGNGHLEEVCIPGNMARILSVVDIFSEQYGGKCMTRSNKNDDSCTKDVKADKEYFFGVNVLLPPSTDLSTVEDFEDALRTKLQEENLETDFLIKDEAKKHKNAKGVPYLRFALAFSL